MAKATSIPSACPSAPLAVNAALPILVRLSDILVYSEAVHDPARVQDLHSMRIAGKRLRYTLEVFSSVIEGIDGFLTTLKRIQDLLGEIHDADVLQTRLIADMDRDGWTPGLQGLLQATLMERGSLYGTFLGEWNQALRDGFPNRLRAAALRAALPESGIPESLTETDEDILRAVALSALAPYAAAHALPGRAKAIRLCVGSLLALSEEPREYRHTDLWRDVMREEFDRLATLIEGADK